MSQISFTWSGFCAGFAAAAPFTVGVLPYGVAFGVLAGPAGLDPAAATAMSALVYSGSAQFVALQVWADPVPLAAVLFAAFAMNARYVLYGAMLRPHLAGLTPVRAYGSLFFLADANWALLVRDGQAGGADGAFLLGSGLAMYLAWTAGTLLGVVLGPVVAAPEKFGLDFLLIAFFVTILVGLWRGRRDVAPLVTAVAAALAVDWLTQSSWGVLAGGVLGSLVGAFRPR